MALLILYYIDKTPDWAGQSFQVIEKKGGENFFSDRILRRSKLLGFMEFR